jgi:hypothetical protein
MHSDSEEEKGAVSEETAVLSPGLERQENHCLESFAVPVASHQDPATDTVAEERTERHQLMHSESEEEKGAVTEETAVLSPSLERQEDVFLESFAVPVASHSPESAVEPVASRSTESPVTFNTSDPIYIEKKWAQEMYRNNPTPPLSVLLFYAEEHKAVMDSYCDNLENLLVMTNQRSRLVFCKIFM